MASNRLRYSILALALTAGRPALAAPTAAEKETARRYMDEGRERLKANDPKGAAAAFKRAHDIMHVPTTGLALARAEVDAGRLVEGRDMALEVARLPKVAGEPPVFDDARQKAEELEVALKGRIPRLRVSTNAGAHVFVDDHELGSLVGTSAATNPGHHVVRATLGSAEKREEVDLKEGEEQSLELVFPPQTAPLAEAPKPVEHEGGGIPPLAIVGLGIAGVGLGVGTITGLMTLGAKGDIEKSCLDGRCDPAVRSDLDRANTLATVSTIGFGAALAGGAITILGFVTNRPSKNAAASSRSQVRPYAGPTGAGIGGTF